MSEELELKQPSVLSVISQVAADPRLDVEKLSRLLDMQERVMKDQRRIAYVAAMARLTDKMPAIDKRGHVIYEGKNGQQGQDRKYAKLEDIDRAIRPLIAEEGFAMSFDTCPGDGGKIRVSCTLSHRDGHSETKQLDLPHDSSGAKNGIQAIGSTVSYGRRMLTKMFFNLMEKDEDDDGGGGGGCIDEEQLRTLETLIQDTKSNKAAFLKLIAGVEKLEDVPAKDFKRCLAALQEKARAK